MNSRIVADRRDNAREFIALEQCVSYDSQIHQTSRLRLKFFIRQRNSNKIYDYIHRFEAQPWRLGWLTAESI